MKWFKHDADASSDAKVKKLIIRHGAVGYAVYFHCIELVTGDISESHLTFELEHDSEIIADNLKINGNGQESGMEIVETIMKTIIELGLFIETNSKIFCLKLAKRLDSSMTSNPKFRSKIKESHDSVMLPSCKKRIEETRLEETKPSKTAKEPKHVHGEFTNVKLTEVEYDKCISKHGKPATCKAIEKLSSYKASSGKSYKSDYAALTSWVFSDIVKEKGGSQAMNINDNGLRFK